MTRPYTDAGDPATVEPGDDDVTLAQCSGNPMTPFMGFWAELNALMINHRLPEILYGEAREIYNRKGFGAQ